MPISAVGISSAPARARRRADSARRQRVRRCSGSSGSTGCNGPSGFTLLELLVVIAIIAISTAGVALALRDSRQTQLDREGERLTALLESARAQSRTSGTAVRWRPVPDGFVLDGLPPAALPGNWLSAGISAQATDGNGKPMPMLLLGPEPIIAAQQIMLSLAGPPTLGLRIASDGLRPFAIAGGTTAP